MLNRSFIKDRPNNYFHAAQKTRRSEEIYLLMRETISAFSR